MYKTLTAEDYKSFLGLPSDYRVDGMLSYGTWDRVKQTEIFKTLLKKSGKNFEYGALPSFLAQVLEFNIEGKRYWFDVSYGGALLSEYLHLACLFGSKKNILLGSCGGLSPKVSSLDLILPTFSFGNESATRMYDPDAVDHRHASDAALTQRLIKKINPKYKVWQGDTTTCQAMMAETLEDVQNWSKEGFLAVEMEAATIFAVSKHFQVPAAAILFVGDNLVKGEMVTSEGYQNNSEAKEEVRNEQYRVALEELLA
jgi:purine-nucleoside phosphorylase